MKPVFKIGDEIIINEDCEISDLGPCFVEEMLPLRGRTFTIADIDDPETWLMIVDGSISWHLTPEWVRPAKKGWDDPNGPVSGFLWEIAKYGSGNDPFDFLSQANLPFWRYYLTIGFVLQVTADGSKRLMCKNKTERTMVLLLAALLARDAGY
jgi:hypothetical protein